MRVHLLGLAHIPTAPENTCCAYTLKAWNLARMMRMLGHEITLYGAEGSDPSVAHEFVQCVSARTLEFCYGAHDRQRHQFRFDQNDLAWREFQVNANLAIRDRLRPAEFEPVLCPFGWAHEPCVRDLPMNAVPIESGIGYRGTFAKFRVFESYAWAHTVWALQTASGSPVGRYYDCVIPNYVDPAMFSYSESKDGCFLYLGRLNWDKGIETVLETCARINERVLLVGQLPQPPHDRAVLERIGRAGAQHRQAVGPVERAKLLASAKALFVPTIYVEPFGGVNIEAQLSGTPVITTDYGAFAETVVHGVTGYRCHTLDDFVWAARHVHELDPWTCREWVLRNYTLDRIAPMYDEFLHKVRDVHTGEGWYAIHEERRGLDWLRRDYPPYARPLADPLRAEPCVRAASAASAAGPPSRARCPPRGRAAWPM